MFTPYNPLTEPYWCMFTGCNSLDWNKVTLFGKYNTPEIRNKVYKWVFKTEMDLNSIPKEDACGTSNFDKELNRTSLFGDDDN